MHLNKLKSSKDKLDKLLESLNYEEDGYWLIRRLNNITYDLNNKIKVEEEILNQDDNIEIPSWTKDGNYYVLKNNDIQYVLHNYKEDKDGSFHVYSYAYIPYNYGFIEFCIRMLGKDKFGDRIFTNSRYYKTRKSQWSHYAKDYGKGKRYPKQFEEHVKFMIDEFNKLPEVNGSFDPFNKESR